jgi:hypothetical protein
MAVDTKQIRVRRDTLANWQAANPVLADGELAWVLDTRDMISGDDTSDFNTLWTAAQSIPNRAATSAAAASASASAAATYAGNAAGVPVIPISAGSKSRLITYGHSFLAEQGLVDVTHYWARRLAQALGLTYPTSDDGSVNDLKRAVGGSTIGDTVARVAGATGLGTPVPAWTPGTKALVVLQCLLNTLRLNGATALDLTSATNYGRAILAVLSASEIIDDTDARITKSAGTWTAATQGLWVSGTAQYNAANGAYFEFVVPGDRDVYIATASRGQNTAGAVVSIADQTAGATLVPSLDLSNQTISSSGIYVWRTPSSARGHTVRVTKTGGTSLYLDAVLPVSPTPPPVLWMKEPYLANYAASTQFPNGSDAAVDAFNAIVDVLAAEFPNVIVANPNKPGYWDKNMDILTSDQVHPNDKGHLDLARAGYDAIRGWQTRKALSLI